MVLIIEIKVFPSAGRSEVVLEESGLLKAYLKGSAERGKANRELIKLCAQTFGVPSYGVSIISGATTRLKKVRIATALTKEQLFSKFVT